MWSETGEEPGDQGWERPSNNQHQLLGTLGGRPSEEMALGMNERNPGVALETVSSESWAEIPEVPGAPVFLWVGGHGMCALFRSKFQMLPEHSGFTSL